MLPTWMIFGQLQWNFLTEIESTLDKAYCSKSVHWPLWKEEVMFSSKMDWLFAFGVGKRVSALWQSKWFSLASRVIGTTHGQAAGHKYPSQFQKLPAITKAEITISGLKNRVYSVIHFDYDQ
jgi:hypothetical protein